MLTYNMGITDSGWDAIWNVINAPAASVQPSGFFPSPQRDTIKSEVTQAAGGTGQTFRETASEGQSIWQSIKYSLNNWIGSPYQDDLSATVKRAESQQVAKLVEGDDPIGNGLEWALATTARVATLYEKISDLWKPRETINEKPRAGYPEGQVLIHTNTVIDKGAEVIETGKKLWDQVKGLFNLGYPQVEPQKSAPVEHDVTPEAGMSLALIALLILGAYLALR